MQHFPESSFTFDFKGFYPILTRRSTGEDSVSLVATDPFSRVQDAIIKHVPYSRLAWNIKAQRYYLPKSATTSDALTGSGKSPKAGDFIKAAAVRNVILDDIAYQETQLQELLKPLQQAAVAYVDGDITEEQWGEAVTQWRDATALQIKYLHLNHLAAARGGYHAMTQAAYGRCGAFLKYHYGKLNNFASDVFNDPSIVLGTSKVRMSADRRIALYAKCGLMTYEAERQVSHMEAGFTIQVNVQHSKESCAGCQAETDRGPHPIGTGVPIGQRECITDYCTYDYPPPLSLV